MQRHALITGAGGELGGALAEVLSAQGWAVGLSYRSSAERAENLAEKIRSRGGEVWLAQADLADPDQVAKMFAEAPAPLSGVVYAAGPRIRLEYISRIGSAEFADAIDNDLKSCVNLFTAAIPSLRETKGSILAVSTMAATRYATRDILSAVPKAGVEMLVKGIAAEEGRHGIRANAVAAGPIDSGDGIWQWFVDQGYYDERSLEIARKQIPLGRFGVAEDIAHAGAFLMSPEAGFITGQVLCIDGGYSV